jgi:hypothetical protein
MINRTKKLRKIARPSFILIILTVFISTLFLVLYKPKAHAQIFLTTGTTWTVPSDWNNSNNTIEVIGGGGGAGPGYSDASGSGGEGGGGGGAGGYSKITNVTLVPGNNVTVAIGGAGTGGPSGAAGVAGTNGTAGGDTYLCNSTSNCTSITDSAVVVGAKGGAGGISGAPSTVGAGGAGGAGSSGIGSTKFNGGTGGAGGPTLSASGGGGGGGGGAGGSSANGVNGTTSTSVTFGGGGRGDGSAGGVGGATNAANGGNGTEYDSTHGSGGGAAGGNGIGNGSGTTGGIGGTYGAAGGGGGGNGSKHGVGGNGGNGNQGLIRIIYSFVSQTDYRFRSDDGDETTGTSLAAQDTQATIVGTTPVRLRFTVTLSGDSATDTFRLEYAPYTTQCGSWTAVPATATTEAFNMFNTTNYTDQAASTNASSGPGVITDPSGFSFTAGKLVSNTSNSATIAMTSGQFTEIEYAFQANSNATNPAYCFRLSNAGTALDNYSNYPILNINYPPSAPTIYSVKDASTNTTRLPVYQLRSFDYNNDYVKYQAELCLANSWPCSSGAQTYTTSDSCWSGYNANGDTAYSAGTAERDSQMAVCTTPLPPTTGILNPNTTYYMRAKAIDPGGSNTYGAYSAVQTFTTGNLDIQINGGTNVNGGTKIGG